MKNLIVFLAITLGLSIGSFAQIVNIPVTKDVTINKLYAGTLSWTAVSIDSLSAKNTAGLRFGTAATWRPSKYLAMYSMAVFQNETGNQSWSMNQFAVVINPSKKLKVTVGNVCTLVTEQRPSPASGDGQFETWTQSKIPGMAPVAKASFAFNSNIAAGLATAQRCGKPEYQANLVYKKFAISWLYDEWNKKHGSVLTFTLGRANEIVVWRQGELISNTLTLDLGKDRDYCLYSDTGYDLKANKLIRGEWGVLKTFSGKYIKGLIGPGYCYEDRSVHAYLYVHL